MSAARFPEADHRPILALDTSSAQGGIALFDGQRLSLRSWAAERSHTTTLLAEVHHLLDADGIGPGEIAAIAVAIGPGAFTGLRVGIGAAKGFHLATDVPLLGVSTLEATALPFASHGKAIVSTIPAGRGRLVWAWYRPVDPGVVETRPPRNGIAQELAEEMQSAGETIIVGEFDDDQRLIVAAAPGACIPPRALRMRQPSAIAEIGWRRWVAGDIDDAQILEPIYLAR